MNKQPVSFDKHLKEELNNPSFRQEWERLEPEFEVIRSLIKLRQTTGLSQRALAKKMGASQAEIGRLETGHNATIKTLQRIADATNKKLKIQFV